MPLEEIVDSDLFRSARQLVLNDADVQNMDPTVDRTIELLNTNWADELVEWRMSEEDVREFATLIVEDVIGA